ncbi:hypothetical protein MUY27_19995 [Mucilaginibacter sp. RS28]|uniref:Uncharacterized protein n=1 Tax=Mucilaginibacter straminoryzae TaxID=2932774 RepID=A0A9X2BBS3_9SPHI|nr:hypothetical protein [Mucilaginibacter straminoryzae]MCJ8212010.1 hypothetical protein [Mucilaginibacter straminoryzae]
MAWTKQSKTCRTVYLVLQEDLEQISQTVEFEPAGALTMDQLQFYSTAASSGIVDAEAKIIAVSYDRILVNSYRRSYKATFDQQSAVAALVEILKDKEKTVEDLSDTTGQIYAERRTA